jgi:phosphoglycolate phosphatase-like HAD superfamily hydrolase
VTKRLILWDIDGTMLTTGRIGRVALEQAAARVADIETVPDVRMSGKTDRLILRDILTGAGVEEDKIDELLAPAMALSIELMTAAHEQIERDGVVHPGVGDVIAHLATFPGVRQSLVTGNLAPNARRKLEALGLDANIDFESGAYGDDHLDRNELVPMALRRVEELREEVYDPDEVWVIGDTDLDLACARAAGVRCLLVGTTWDGEQDTSTLDADAYFDDLSDTDAVVSVLLG